MISSVQIASKQAARFIGVGIKPLKHVLAYSNDAVIDRFKKDFGLSAEDAITLFSDVKRFLWLAAVEGIVAPPPKIDEGWHTFIIFTEEYEAFCYRNFGRFMHHRPLGVGDKSDGAGAVRSAINGVNMHFGSFQSLSTNWLFPGMKVGDCTCSGQCSSDSVSCAPTPSCSSSVRTRIKKN